MSTLFQDLQFSLRTLRKSPGFALTAILTLGLGIGAVTSVFSVVNGILLKPFNFPQADRLVVLRETAREFGNKEFPVNYKHYLNWKTNAKSLQDVAIFANGNASISSDQHSGAGDHPEIVGSLNVSASFFPVLGVQPPLGRNFLPSEAVKGHDSVVILTWNAWQKYFQGSPSAIGRTLSVGGSPFTVVGVLPRGFSLPHLYEMQTVAMQQEVHPYQIFRPFYPAPFQMSDSGDYDFLAIGRLKPGISLAQAKIELDGLQQAFIQAAHLPYHGGIAIKPLRQDVASGVSTGLWLLLSAVGAVLLIACVNLANLQLARAVSRDREMAVRSALGAGRERLARAALTDSLVLAVAGGALGILLSFMGVRLFLAAAPAGLPLLNQVHVSLPVLAMACGLSILTALMFGMLPALRAMRAHPQAAMQSSSSRVMNSREGQRTRHLLVAGEVAFTVVLLIVTGLLVRSFSHLLTQQRDFNAEHVALAEVHLFNPQYGDSIDTSQGVRSAFVERALADLAQLPGVKSAAMTSQMPLTGETWIDGIERPDHPLPPEMEPQANMRWVSPMYASTLQIPLLRGRDLGASDKTHPRNVLISNQTAKSVWPGEDPVGKTFKAGNDSPYTVVGVIADARVNDLKSTANMIYLPYWDNPPWGLYFLVRSSQPAAALSDSIRRTLWTIDPNIPIPAVKSLDEQVNDSVATERFQTIVLSAFGIAALLLALLGVYGVLAYSVSLRQQEFGIRIALGSGRSALMRLVVRQASMPVIGGIVAGLLLALGAVRAVRSLLYETGTSDPVVIGASVLLLLVAALLAAWLPARRAASTDPMQALRAE